MIADIVGEILFELVFAPAAWLWPRLTRRASEHGIALRALIYTCAVLIIVGVYILAIAVIVGAVIFVTGWL